MYLLCKLECQIYNHNMLEGCKSYTTPMGKTENVLHPPN
jgi:hypothetical protein